MATSSGNTGIGIVGSGFMGKTYARTVATLVEHADLAAVALGSGAPELAGEYGIPAEPTLDALLLRDDVDVVCIATPHALHGEQALAAAQAGKHILIDKPMACTTGQCDAILAECREKSVRCDITYTQRERVCNIEARNIIKSGQLGPMRYMRNTQVVPDGMESTPKWQLDPANIGILMGHAIHNIDQVRWFTDQEVVRVFAKVRSLKPRYEVDSTSDIILTLEDGTVCTIFCTFEMPKPGIPRTGGATQVIFDNGIIDSDWYGELRVSEHGGPWEVVAKQEPIDWAGKGFLDPVRLKTYAAIIQRLADDVRSGSPKAGTGWDGRQAVAIAEAAYESSKTGREIKL